MDEKRQQKKMEKINKWLWRFWKTRPGPEDVDKMIAQIRDVVIPRAGDQDDLLLWIKIKELGWWDRFRDAVNKRADSRDGDTRNRDRLSRLASLCEGSAEAYRDVWRQVLFPGKSVQDGTLDPDVLASAEKEWTEKAEEKLRKSGEGER